MTDFTIPAPLACPACGGLSLREYRARIGITQQEFARLSGIGAKTVRRAECGIRVSAKIIEAIREYTGGEVAVPKSPCVDFSLGDYVKEHLAYDPVTGAVTRKTGVGEGKLATSVASHGYLVVSCKGRRVYAHQVAWFFTHGHFGVGLIDHINRCRSDNRIDNLRRATCSQNGINRGPSRRNKLGIKGVHERLGSFRAFAHQNGKSKSLGCFKTAAEAEKVYLDFVYSLHGEFAVPRETKLPQPAVSDNATVAA